MCNVDISNAIILWCLFLLISLRSKIRADNALAAFVTGVDVVLQWWGEFSANIDVASISFGSYTVLLMFHRFVYVSLRRATIYFSCRWWSHAPCINVCHVFTPSSSSPLSRDFGSSARRDASWLFERVLRETPCLTDYVSLLDTVDYWIKLGRSKSQGKDNAFFAISS